MSQQKPKREFLKRGSRKFLANSSVKRQPYKLHSFQPGEQNDFEQIKIAPRKVPQKLSVQKQRPVQPKKQSRIVKDVKQSAQSHPQPAPRVPIHTRVKKVENHKDISQIPKWNNTVDEDEVFEVRGKKHNGTNQNYQHQSTHQHQYQRQVQKPHSSNYEEQQQEGLSNYLNKRKPKPSTYSQASGKKEHPIKDYSLEKNQYEQEPNYYKKHNNNFMKQQKQFKYDEDDQQEVVVQNPRKMKEPESNKIQPQTNKSNKNSYKPQIIQSREEQQSEGGVDFNDDEDFEPKQHLRYSALEEPKPKPQIQHQQSNHRQNQNYEPEETPVYKQPVQLPKRSKLVQQIFMKNKTNNKGSNSSANPPVGKLKITDISEQLKIQIVEEGIKKIQQKLDQQIEKISLDKKNLSLKIFKYDEQFRQLQKLKKKQQDQYQEKKKAFQEQMKKQRAKIAKDQKIIKQSLQSRYTRKDKLQIGKYQKDIQELKEEKKKSENKSRMQIQRLKQKLKSEVIRNKQLQQTVRILELDRIKQQQQNFKQKDKQKVPVSTFKQTKPLNQTSFNPNRNVYIFTQGPDPRISQMSSPTFSLDSLPITSYSHQSNIYYQEYKSFPRNQQIISQKRQGKSIVRQYKDRRIQVQFQNNHVKQIFPNNYKIVHFVKGHIKQQLPEGVTIYYDNDSSIVEFLFGENKKIHYFEEHGQVEMKIQQQDKVYHEIYDGRNLKNKVEILKRG